MILSCFRWNTKIAKKKKKYFTYNPYKDPNSIDNPNKNRRSNYHMMSRHQKSCKFLGSSGAFIQFAHFIDEIDEKKKRQKAFDAIHRFAPFDFTPLHDVTTTFAKEQISKHATVPTHCGPKVYQIPAGN